MSNLEEFDDEDWEEEEYMLASSDITFQEGEGKPWESKLGGCPYLHTKEDYPIGQNGKPMLFLAQINLKDIHNSPILPDHGLLQFFVEQNQLFGVEYDPLVRWIEDVSETENGLLLEHPYADQEYVKALPYERPGKIFFAEVPQEEEDEPSEDSRVGGYPCYQQDGEMEPNEFLLLQLADEGECGIGFGDCGVCRFIIDKEDLAARDFSNVSYDWDCC